MTPLPVSVPATGLRHRIRLGREYYVRVDSNDYSVDPRCLGRFVDIHATATTVTITRDGEVVGAHPRCWARRETITDPAHVGIAKTMRAAFAEERIARERANRQHTDGHRVALRALTDYDTLFGGDFTTGTTPEKAMS